MDWIRDGLTREPQEYQHATLNAIVARQLMAAGVSLHAGESIQYIITNAQAGNPRERALAFEMFDAALGYDVEKYAELLLRAIATILQPAGLDYAQLAERSAAPQEEERCWQIPLVWRVGVETRHGESEKSFRGQ